MLFNYGGAIATTQWIYRTHRTAKQLDIFTGKSFLARHATISTQWLACEFYQESLTKADFTIDHFGWSK